MTLIVQFVQIDWNMGANDAKAAAEHKFQIYDADKGTFLGRTGASWRKFCYLFISEN